MNQDVVLNLYNPFQWPYIVYDHKLKNKSNYRTDVGGQRCSYCVLNKLLNALSNYKFDFPASVWHSSSIYLEEIMSFHFQFKIRSIKYWWSIQPSIHTLSIRSDVTLLQTLGLRYAFKKLGTQIRWNLMVI